MTNEQLIEKINNDYPLLTFIKGKPISPIIKYEIFKMYEHDLFHLLETEIEERFNEI